MKNNKNVIAAIFLVGLVGAGLLWAGRFITLNFYLTGFVLLVLIVYFIWMLVNVRKENEEKFRQLSKVEYMYDVEKLLFHVHMAPGNMEKALQKIGEAMEAEQAFFLTVDGKVLLDKYQWQIPSCKEQGPETHNRELPPLVYESLVNGKNVLVSDLKKMEQEDPANALEYKKLYREKAVLTPVEDADGHLAGVLGTVHSK